VAVPDEQRQPKFLLELVDVTAEGRLGDVEPFGGFGDAQGVCDCDKCPYMPKIHIAGGFYTRTVYQTLQNCIGHLPSTERGLPRPGVYRVQPGLATKEGFACV
jgi:hypothetical protein